MGVQTGLVSLALGAALCSCRAAEGSYRLELVFPDAESREQTSQVQVWVFPAASARCWELIEGALSPRDLPVLTDATLPVATPGSGELQEVPPGDALFFVEGSPWLGDQVLRGCRAARVQDDGDQEIVVELGWVCGRRDDAGAACWDAGESEAGRDAGSDAAQVDGAAPDIALADTAQADTVTMDAIAPDLSPGDVPRLDAAPLDAVRLDVAQDDGAAPDALLADGAAEDVGATCTPEDCDDDEPCTEDSCNPSLQVCEHRWQMLPGAEGTAVMNSCSNGVDDDCDGFTDAEDPLCGAPRQLYRSVGPGKTSALALGSGSAPLAMEHSVVRFSSPLPDNVGVGDALLLDTTGTAAVDIVTFIYRRVSSTEVLVTDAEGVLLDLSGETENWALFRAYTSLKSAAERLSENVGIPAILRDFDRDTGATSTDLVANDTCFHLACYADAVDVYRVAVFGWTTDQTHFLRVFAPSRSHEVGTSQRHDGVVGGGYVLGPQDDLPGEWYNIFFSGVDFARIEGLEISGAGVLNAENIRGAMAAGRDVRLDGLLIHDVENTSIDDSDVSAAHGIFLQEGKRISVTNCTIFDIASWSSHPTSVATGITADPDLGDEYYILYNNTVFDVRDEGGGYYAAGIEGVGLVPTFATNNVVLGVSSSASSSTHDYKAAGGRFDPSCTNNATTDQTAPGSSPIELLFTAPADYFESATDLHVRAGSQAAVALAGSAVDLSADPLCAFDTDLDLDKRPAGAWDLGADQIGAE